MNLWKRIKSMDAYSTVCPVTVSNQIQELKPSWTVNFSLTTWLGIKHSWHNICSLWFSKQLKRWIIGLAVADTAKISLLGLLLPMNGTPFCFPNTKGKKLLKRTLNVQHMTWTYTRGCFWLRFVSVCVFYCLYLNAVWSSMHTLLCPSQPTLSVLFLYHSSLLHCQSGRAEICIGSSLIPAANTQKQHCIWDIYIKLKQRGQCLSISATIAAKISSL